MARTKPIEPDGTLGDKSEQILQGAMQEFLTHGYAGTSMDKVAKTGGVSKATVYSYFQDKEGLFAALVQWLARKKVHFTILDEEPAVALRFIATTILDQATHEPEFLNFVRLVIAESGRFPQLAQTFVRNLAKPGIDRLTEYLTLHPELKLSDPEATARIFIGSLVYFQLTQEMMHGKDIMPMERDRAIDALLHLILPAELNS
ncbi:MAG: TetR/AcrR family transcriptional regulator [Microcoleus sp. PH2017_29_MFU_D_A]|jgi:AcrR family transcriptional regulator|uniref:TetR/AcrR family transcriptional regulator n=1 Tax=unclassified Microcoleus TaxID=2642155 RepID=UPI001DAAF65E|nr:MULTISPECIES: TetR/AcrR family transcriptional regulator [unclassified Microcoleus]MCC3419786.1 TetR/AcrR family transcriptional regulator [Microcoleus sp. PH2017_07_MST_O_A]MCC3429503.1 TetR/AcrR family transcriptional regulator [Microcoleus sp. PH2017_04_SCI_O_A]MCC3442497.1 TetR/AcrR family transcriptional regulator [Microcoleus sp. PH2017_03_ELD_O_A]MCC3468474.1 TetR/AcrR family transcriptional regulator [Microcoleus sp. PH2017_06_SFM_O_A]MCC3502240.1 TetR/AcrR family transcriptional re